VGVGGGVQLFVRRRRRHHQRRRSLNFESVLFK
jgi:hypothetical protein